MIWAPSTLYIPKVRQRLQAVSVDGGTQGVAKGNDVVLSFGRNVGEDKSPKAATATLPETNIAPKNGWLEYYFPIGKAYFQGLC